MRIRCVAVLGGEHCDSTLDVGIQLGELGVHHGVGVLLLLRGVEELDQLLGTPLDVVIHDLPDAKGRLADVQSVCTV